MKAISTKVLGPTNMMATRIVASDLDGNRIIIPYPHEQDTEAAHHRAADALCRAMDWAGPLIGGATRTGYVFVFVEGHEAEANNE